MILVKPSFKIEDIMGGALSTFGPLRLIEYAGRTCYKSEDLITSESSEKFIRMILKRGHESVIEHSAMTVKFIVDRGVTHELVRHRLCAFSQESTRYVNYKGGCTFVIPPWINLEPGEYSFNGPKGLDKVHLDFNGDMWFSSMISAEETYCQMVSRGWSPQQARSILPNSTKTEIVTTANFREWRHIFKLRTSEAAHPQMREIMIPLLAAVKQLIPVIFDEI